ncbi:toll/interleukin-1 receptor domain-containing protein, partial [bacterium]|nr:toll/interleukin-1 receptor domain-containing protein [bacterium]
MANVFVSYSRQDIEFAKKLVEWLEKKGHRVWMDKKRILGGADYREEIADGISSADVFISLLSPDSVTSKWVKREIYYADDKDKFIIPVLVRFVKFPQEFQLALTGVHYVDLTAASSKKDPWSELERALEQAKAGAPVSQTMDADQPRYKGLQDYMAKKIKRK